jgi:hypothetical protein
MHLADFDFVVIDGEAYCTDCVRDTDGEDVEPIFAGSEWQTAPVCGECGAVCESVTVIDRREEAAVRAFTDVDWAYEDRCMGGVDPDWYRE